MLTGLSELFHKVGVVASNTIYCFRDKTLLRDSHGRDSPIRNQFLSASTAYNSQLKELATHKHTFAQLSKIPPSAVGDQFDAPLKRYIETIHYVVRAAAN